MAAVDPYDDKEAEVRGNDWGIKVVESFGSLYATGQSMPALPYNANVNEQLK